jgi:hypothetical protein
MVAFFLILPWLGVREPLALVLPVGFARLSSPDRHRIVTGEYTICASKRQLRGKQAARH